jgi:hypothetical protein
VAEDAPYLVEILVVGDATVDVIHQLVVHAQDGALEDVKVVALEIVQILHAPMNATEVATETAIWMGTQEVVQIKSPHQRMMKSPQEALILIPMKGRQIQLLAIIALALVILQHAPLSVGIILLLVMLVMVVLQDAMELVKILVFQLIVILSVLPV